MMQEARIRPESSRNGQHEGRSRKSPKGQNVEDLPLMTTDQACKECRRRKAKCDRGLPTCNLCIRYTRHCLYEKHSKTPLTRKHLTDVEERLERAEALLKAANLMPSTASSPPPQSVPLCQDSTPLCGLPNEPQNTFDFSNLTHPIPGSKPDFLASNSNSLQQDQIDLFNLSSQDDFTYSTSDQNLDALLASHDFSSNNFTEQPEPVVSDAPVSSNPLECPPMDDFEWDERHMPPFHRNGQDFPPWVSKSSENGDEEEDMIDGMASLTMDDKEGGYLGVASGAALLRIIDPEPLPRRRATSLRPRVERFSSESAAMAAPLYEQPNPNRHIIDTMIDAYFKIYHVSYPIVHEPTFRAQYSEVIPRPNGDCWLILAYTIAAIGIFTTAKSLNNSDLPIFAHAKSMLSINFLETANLTLVQALTLISNYQQKRNMPNSGYNYLGLAQRMAMGLGLHKEFSGWNISPLKMEIRRRVWWSLCVFDVGATITFSRPMTWPGEGIEVALPLNVSDRDLTASSQSYPAEIAEITPYTAVRMQASFHMATNSIYSRVISKPLLTAQELLTMDNTIILDWLAALPSYFIEQSFIPPKYSLAHAIMMWRYRNLRIIMYRPFVIRKAVYDRDGRQEETVENQEAYERCLHEAKSSINAINEFCSGTELTRVAAWYALYFLFQAALIPCICLRNSPHAVQAPDWRAQVLTTLNTISTLVPVNSSSVRCHQVILKLCEQFLHAETTIAEGDNKGFDEHYNLDDMSPINESPQTQMNHVYNMMWPNVSALEADVVMQDDAWMEFLRGENTDFETSGTR